MSSMVVLNAEHQAVQHLCKVDRRLAKVIALVGEVKYEPHTDNPYVFLVHEIIEQMLSVKAGAKIFERLEILCDGEITPAKIAALTDEQIRSTGTAGAKVTYIKNLTDLVLSETLDLSKLSLLSDEEVISKLVGIRGIGSWTAKMYLLFVLDRPDVLPYEDVAFLQAFCWMQKTSDRNKDIVLKKCKKWKPYSSTASRFLYRALDMGLTKTEFHLFK